MIFVLREKFEIRLAFELSEFCDSYLENVGGFDDSFLIAPKRFI